MTELEHVEIEGFKGLEHVEFEPTDINLITGRNNTGKTSFLEAVDLLLQPHNISEFRDNLNSVINSNWGSSEIRGITGESDVMVDIHKPPATAASKYFSKAILQGVEYKLFSSEPNEIEGNEEKIHREIESQVQQGLEEKVTEKVSKNLRDEILVLSTGDQKHPYLLGGDQSRTTLEEIVEEAVENLDKKYNIQDIFLDSGSGFVAHVDLDAGETKVNLETGKVHLDPPFTTHSVQFITEAKKIERSNDDDQEPIKIDDIGDYIKETGLVDNLKTFTLDYLVFEGEGGEKEQIPYEFMGDGFKSIVGLLWELMDDDTEDSIVLIEEPENHMHPGYVLELVHFLIDLARDEDIQFFITTHDHDFIKDFFMDMPGEKHEYLEDEFSLLRMDDFGAESLDYETAEHELKDLHLDLRGI